MIAPKDKPARSATSPAAQKGGGKAGISKTSTTSKAEVSPRGNTHNYPVVEILWIDAVADGLQEWMTPEDLEHLEPVDSLVVGYLIKECETHMTVASLINEGSVAHALCIPREIILHVRRWT